MITDTDLGPSAIFFVEVSDVIKLHDDMIRILGGMSGLRDEGLLESAIQHPLHVIEYGAPEEQEIHYLAAVYFFHIIKNHAFYDGNKRTGVLVALIFLEMNGFVLDVANEALYQVAIDTAKSSLTIKEIATFFKNNT